MNVEKFTNKSREALMRAQQSAQAAGHTELRALHLLSALLDDDESLVNSILEKLGVNKALFRSKVTSALSDLPRVSGTAPQEVVMTGEFSSVLNNAMLKPLK